MTDKEFAIAIDYCYSQLHPVLVIRSEEGVTRKKMPVSSENLERLEQGLLDLLAEATKRGWFDDIKPGILQ